MIFKKIYTFLNNYFNGNKISKAFSTLIFTLIFSGTLFCSDYLGEASAQNIFDDIISFFFNEDDSAKKELEKERLNAQNQATQANRVSEAVVQYKKDGSGDKINEHYILYQKAGLQPDKIYTSYLPPKDSYNKNTDTEHTLNACGNIGTSGLKMIGRDCMIAIPFDCDTASSGNFPTGITASEGVNCLNYSKVFEQGSINGKKLRPHKCDNTKTDGRTCLSIEKDYCHVTNKPILGINCRLAPCNSIPNEEYRRPGVNCLADCNNTTTDNISQPKFFMEGFNCLSSCRTFGSSPTEPTRIIGQDCVLEFNENVMPLCTAHPEGSTKHFNETTRKNKREDCLSLEDLPLFFSDAGQLDLINSVKECTSVTPPRPNINCINFDPTSKECHRYGEIQSLEADAQRNIRCKKIDCHKLSDTELKRSFNAFILENNRSTEKYCIPSLYTKFNFVQAMAINSRDSSTNPRYLADYLLAIKPCYGRGDTEEIEAILSSDYYDSSPNNKIDYLKTQASNSGYFPGRKDNEGLYDLSKACPLDNVSQAIECVHYRASKSNNNGIAQRPYDCNASSYCAECPQSLEICSKDTDKICYKNGINCNNPVNSPYAVCKEQILAASKTDNKDEYVSWFFRPTLPADAFKENQDKSYSLISMSGYPMENSYSSTGGDDIYMSKAQVQANGFGNITQPWDVLWSSRSITPPSIGNSVGVPGVGAGYICGMNNDYRGIPSDDAVYFKGEVRTAYEADSKASHEIDVCIRYAASGTLPWESCGYRKCKTSCAFGACTKICGIDVCRRLKIIENSSQNCNSINTGDTDCTKNYKTELDAVSAETRVRIYKPDSSNYICAVLEFRGITTDMVRRPFLNGTEYFEVPDPNDATKTKKICVSGGSYIDSSNSCKGVNSNDNDAITTGWRTSKIVRYIMEPPHPYKDLTGRGPAELPSNHIDMRTGQPVNQTIGRVKFNIKRYFEKSDCIRHQERVAGPVFFAIATPSNSERLFLPSIKIEKKCRIAIAKEAGVTTGTECDSVDETDFFKPAITISFGKLISSNSILSDDLNTINTNHKIIKIEDPNSNISGDYKIKAANIGIASVDVTSTVFIKKESSGLQPRLCLYKKIISAGNPAQYKSQVIECVNRRRATRAMIYPPSAPTHTTRQFEVGFLKDEISLHSSITNLLKKTFVFDDMTDKINNNDNLIKCLEIPSQGFPICIKREKCSLLNNECVENEKQLITLNNASTLDYAAIKQRQLVSNYCKKDLLVECNLKKGYELTADNQTLNTSKVDGKGFNAPANDNYHGWFNEFCIESGIAKLDDTNTDEKIYVQRNVTTNEQLGSCIKDPNCSTSPLTAPCINDGSCLRTSCCKIVKVTDPLSSLATPHELDLCLEITDYLKSCPAISFGRNTKMSDPYFVGESFLSLASAHPSHVGRRDSITSHGTLSYNSHHAEYEVSYSGSTGVKGECNGFYTYANKDNFPTADCTAEGTWDNFRRDACAMYSCPDKKLEGVTGANQVGQYPSSYDSTNSPEGSKRGLFEGYANWNALQKTTLLKESATATSCIVGYAKKGATNGADEISIAETTNQATLNSLNTYKSSSDEKGKVINALYGKYKGLFTGGISPTRNCNQLGIWESVTDACERITCPAISFDQPVEAGAFYMNDYILKFEVLAGKNTIFTEKSPYSPSATPIKAKFNIERSINSPVYLSAVNTSHSINGFLIKMKSGSSTVPASITANTTYVVKLIAPASGDKYWEIMNNTNDNVLIVLWQKSKGASFPAGYAVRSTLFNYPDSDSGSDPEDRHKVTGVCNEDMQYRSIGSPPQLTCDSNGNWVNLINPCVSDCGAISDEVGNNAIHGFARWNKASTKVGFSDTVASTGCVSGFFKYPYAPLFDNEGAKKDFGIGVSETVFDTSDSYHAIANTDDGASFKAQAGVGENLNPGTMNSEGRAYNLKINTSNSQSQSVASSSSQESVKTLFYLFNTAPLAMVAPEQTVWSKIKFSSFGAPLYYSDKNIVETACHLPYSKLILANKCIGKKTCSIELSDFTSYNGTPCANTNLGFGLDGEQNVTVNSYGSGGGGGGGNNPGNGGSSVGSLNINGASGSSYYDKSFHFNAPTLSDAGNKGSKVDLKVADTDDNLKAKFKGKDGSVKIIESVDQVFSEVNDRTVNYVYSLSSGEQTHTVTTVPPAGQDFIYIKYEMSGAGGGGGGQGLTQGTDGASGTKMTGGVFKVKTGDVLKIYVGGGGGAGKTKCRSSQGAFLDPKITQPAIEIIEPTKKTNLAIKILNKIGSLIVSEGWAQEKKCYPSSIEGIEFPCGPMCTSNSGTISLGTTEKACKAGYQGKVIFTCQCPESQIYSNRSTFPPSGLGKTDTSTERSGETSVVFYPDTRWGAKVSRVSLKILRTDKAQFKIVRVSDGVTLFTQNLEQDNYRPTNGIQQFSSEVLAANTAPWEKGALKFTYNNTNPTGKYSALRATTTGILAYQVEYKIPAEACTTNLSYTGSCTEVTCSATGTGYEASGLTKTSIGKTGTIACGGTSYPLYNGSVSYTCSPTGVINVTGSCGCVAGYDKKGTSTSCTPTICYKAAGNGYGQKLNLPFATEGNGDITCDQAGYTGNAKYTCLTSGEAQMTQACGCATGYVKNTSGQCVQLACSYPNGYGYEGANSRPGASGSLICGGRPFPTYSSSTNAAYTCTASTTGSTLGTFTLTRGCECASGYTKTTAMGACSRITCFASGGKGYGNQSVDYSSSGATITCGGASYPAYSSTNATYTCTGPTTSTTTAGTFALVTPCACATGYYDPDGSGNCVLSTCQVSSEYNIRNGPVNAATTATSVACKEGYYGTPTYTCIRGDYVQTGTCARIQCTAPSGSNSNLIDGSSLDFTLGTASVNLTCNLGYASSLGATRPSYTCKDGIGTVGAYLQNGTCNPISCTISPGDGYAGRTLSGKDKFPCDTGYHGDINYTCGANNAVTLTGSCSRLRCNLPEGANSDIVPLANSNPPYREVFYSPTSNPLTYRCAPGYKKKYSQDTFGYVDPTYTCVTNNSIAEYQNPCEIVRCYSYGQKIYDYNGGKPQTDDCDTNSGYWDTSEFICSIEGKLEWIRQCKKIKCLIPTGKNTTLDNKWVDFSASASGLDCAAGFYYTTRPSYTCIYNTNSAIENRGLLTFTGSCERITCRIPDTLHSIKDNDIVNWGTAYVDTTCKSGFYQVDPLKPPSYLCSGADKEIGDLRTKNPCAPVTCDLPEDLGISAKTNLEYGLNKTVSCDKSGYSGIVTYNCLDPVNAGKGVRTPISSTCTEASCVASGNNAVTFGNYVISTGVGGIGGKISNAIEFLKGGNGGSATGTITPVGSSTPTSRTSGSGGGGGSASMIAINQRIIAIAGGGGGGAGGGADANTSDAKTKYSNIDNLDIILKSNVFGPYFIGEMQYSKINVSEAKTTGILYGHTTSPNPFSLNTIPPGTYINEILFASHGNPVLPKTSLDPLIWKYGNCNDPNSLSKSINQCGGKTSCSIDVNAQFTYCQSLPTKEFGLVASYYYKEPTLQVVSSAGLPAYQIKENSGNQVDLKNGEVYTFVLGEEGNTPFWFKYPYLSDEYMISSPIPAPLPNTKTKIRIKFHRTNSTFYPTLKTNLSSWPLPIFKSYEPGKTTSLSVNYINTDINYILTLENNYWIIRESTSGKVDGALLENARVLPTRSCTTNKISSTGDAVNVAWSLPSSSCVNYCPGYDPVTKIGDDRINVGATEHLTSTSQGTKGIAYWRNGVIGQSSVMKFSNIINNGVFPEYTNIVSASDFRSNPSRSYFALSRYCGPNGVWSDPIPLCAFAPSSSNNDSGIPVAGGTSYIYFNQPQGLLTDSVNKYLRVNDNSDIALSSCKDLHFPQTANSNGYLIPNNYDSKIYDPPRYKCVSSASNFVDRTYFEEVPDTANTRPCVQYCDVNKIPQNTISYNGQDDYKVRIKSSILPSGAQAPGLITLECASGFAYKLVQKTFTFGSFTLSALVRSDIKPKVECLLQNGAANWGSILDNCEVARRCTFDDKKFDTVLLGGAYNSYRFPIWPYIMEIHRSGGMAHNDNYTYDIPPPDYYHIPSRNDDSYIYKKYPRKNGKCGYCRRSRESNRLQIEYKRKFLRSYSCNDGAVSYVWDKEIYYDDDASGYNVSPYNGSTDNRDGDPDINLACDTDNWDYIGENHHDHPESDFLGWCTTNAPGENFWTDLFNGHP